jgi:hypothetical protein
MSETGALLGFDIVLNINEQVNSPVIPFRLSGWAGPSGNPSGNCFLRIIGARNEGFYSLVSVASFSPFAIASIAI